MKRQALSNFAVCSLLCLPVLALRGDEKQGLREELSRTVNSLATFTDIQKQIVARDPKAVAELLAISDAGPIDATEAESTMMALRIRINALQEILDARAASSGEVAHAPANAATPGAVAEIPQTASGFAAAPSPIEAVAAVNASAGTKIAFEKEDYVADRARLGRACWRGARYQEGVAALEPLAGQPKADYWRARCLEKLARNAEALELYKKVIEIAGDSPEGKCAREDREFLEWSMGHGLVGTP